MEMRDVIDALHEIHRRGEHVDEIRFGSTAYEEFRGDDRLVHSGGEHAPGYTIIQDDSLPDDGGVLVGDGTTEVEI